MEDLNWLKGLRDTLAQLHAEAVEAHLDFEVFTGYQDAAFLAEFEHALSHIAVQIVNGSSADEVPHIRSHLQRIIVEAREFIAEEYLTAIRDRLDPFRKHPKLCKSLLMNRPAQFQEYIQRVRVIQELIRDGRRNKGHDGTYEVARDKFREAARLAAQLDADIPQSQFRDRLFTVVVAAVFFFLGILVQSLVSLI